MTIRLPTGLDDLNLLVGADFPEADEDALWRLASAWGGAAARLRALGADSDQLAQVVVGAVDDATGAAFSEHWQRLAAGDEGSLAQLVAACEQLAAACDGAAREVEYAKLQYIAALVVLAATIATLLGTAIFGGVSTAGIPIAVAAAQFTVRLVLVRLITSMAMGAAFTVALDAIAQGIQFLDGHRDQWDWAKTQRATEDGAIFGAIGGAVFLGAGRLVPTALGSIGSVVGAAGIAGGLGGVLTPLVHGEVATGKDILTAVVAGAAGGLAPDFRPGRVAGLELAGIDLDPAVVDRAGLDRAGLDRAGLDRAGLDRAGLGSAVLDPASGAVGELAHGQVEAGRQGVAADPRSGGTGLTPELERGAVGDGGTARGDAVPPAGLDGAAMPEAGVDDAAMPEAGVDDAAMPEAGQDPLSPQPIDVVRPTDDAHAMELVRGNAFATDAGVAFYPAGDEVRPFADAVRATDGYVTLDLHGSRTGFAIGEYRLTPRQFALALRELFASGGAELPEGAGIKLLSCDTAYGGESSVAAQLARELGVAVIAPDQPVWTAMDGKEIVSSPVPFGGFFVPTYPPDGQWHRFCADGTETALDVTPGYHGDTVQSLIDLDGPAEAGPGGS